MATYPKASPTLQTIVVEINESSPVDVRAVASILLVTAPKYVFADVDRPAT
jgi:hypothetical protein